MNRRRRGSQSLSCDEDNGENVEPGRGPNRSKKAASAEPFASSSNEIHTDSSESRREKKKPSFWSNLFKSKISEKDENNGNVNSSSFESVNSVATTNSFSFVSPKKYKGKGKGKRIPVDEQTLPRGRERDGNSLSRSRNAKVSTLSRFGMKIGLKKKYNLQSCESLQNILSVPAVPQVQAQTQGPQEETIFVADEEASPQMSSGYDSSTWGTNTRRKRRAPAPPTKKVTTAPALSNQVIEVPGRDSGDKGKINVELKSITPLRENELAKRESFPSGALRRNKSAEKGPRPLSCSTSIFAHHSKYQYNTKTRTHVKGKKKAPAPPNPFGDPDAPEEPYITSTTETVSNNIPGNQIDQPKVLKTDKVEVQTPSRSQGVNSVNLSTESPSIGVSENWKPVTQAVEISKPTNSFEVERKSSETKIEKRKKEAGNEAVKARNSATQIDIGHISGKDVKAAAAQKNPTNNIAIPEPESENSVLRNGPTSSSSNIIAKVEIPNQVPEIMPLPSLHEASEGNRTAVSGMVVTNLHESPSPQTQLDDEIAQNILNDRQEKELESTDSPPPHIASVSTSEPLPSTSKSSKGTKTRFFNFSKTRNSYPDRVTEKDIQEAESELDALLHADCSGSLKVQAKKVDEQVKAQLVELKKESDKSPLLFFAPKSKKSTQTGSTSSSFSVRSQNSQHGSSSPIHNPSSPEPPSSPEQTKVTPRPWYKRSISSSKSPGGSKPKVSPKPTITHFTKFSDLDREAQRIVEENRRKSAEVEFNQNARELINMFNSTFIPTAEEESGGVNNDNIENSTNLRTEEMSLCVITPSMSLSRADADELPVSIKLASPTSTVTTATASSSIVSGSSTTVITNSKPRSVSYDQKNDAITQSHIKNKASTPFVPPVSNGISKSSIMTSATFTNGSQVSSTTTTPTTAVVLSARVAPYVRDSVSALSSDIPVSAVGSAVTLTVSSSRILPTTILTSTTPSVAASPRISSSVPETSATTASHSNTSSTTTCVSNSKSSEPEWPCPRCTLKNAHWRAICEACYHRKDSASSNVNPITSIFERVNANKVVSPVVNNSSSTTAISIPSNVPQSIPLQTSSEQSKQPKQLTKPIPSNIPSCENFLSQLPSKDGSAKGKLQGMKLSPAEDPEVEELDIEKLRQARLAFFAKDQQSSSKSERRHDSAQRVVADSLPNNLAACPSESKTKPKKLNTTNVFTDGEDDSIDFLLQLKPQQPPRRIINETDDQTEPSNQQIEIPTAGQRPWKPSGSLPYRFQPMLESISEADSNYYSSREFHRIYENWQLNQQQSNENEQSFSGPSPFWVNGCMNFPVQQNVFSAFNQFNVTVADYPQDEYEEDERRFAGGSSQEEHFSNFRPFNNPLHPSSPIESDPNFHLNNNSASSSDTEGVLMDRTHRGHKNSSLEEERQLTYEDYRKRGAIPKGYHYSSDHEERRFSGGEPSRWRSSGRRRYDDEFSPHFIEPRSPQPFSSAENKVGVDKLLRKLEWAISHGEHRLAAKLAHDLAIRKVNCGASPPNKQEPVTIRVYVEDRFMQQGPFLVQVMPSIYLKDLKLKIEGDWGIPSGFQKWILGKRMAEDDSEPLSYYEVTNDTMAFLYLVTPQIDQLKQESISRSNEPLPPLIPDKPMINSTTGSLSNGNSVHSSRNGFSSPEIPDNKMANTNAVRKVVSSIIQTDNGRPITPLTIQKQQDPPELPMKLYQKPTPPTGSKGLEPQYPNPLEKLVQPTSTPRGRTPDRNPSSLVEPSPLRPSKDIPMCSKNGTASGIPNSSESQTPPKIDPVIAKSDMNQFKSKISPPLSNRRDHLSTERQQKTSINSNGHTNLLPISLQQKLVNLREAAEQAFGKSFGQPAQNSGKLPSPTGSSLPVEIVPLKHEIEIVRKQNCSVPKQANISPKVKKYIHVSNDETDNTSKSAYIKTSNSIKNSSSNEKPIELNKNSVVQKTVTPNSSTPSPLLNSISGSSLCAGDSNESKKQSFAKTSVDAPPISNNVEAAKLLDSQGSHKIEAATVSVTSLSVLVNGREPEKDSKKVKAFDSCCLPQKKDESTLINGLHTSIQLINGTELVVDIGEPKPVPRVKKQDNTGEVSSAFSKASPTTVSKTQSFSSDISTESPKIITNGIVTPGSVPSQPTPPKDKAKAAETVQKVHNPVDGFCQTTLAYPPPKSPSRQIPDRAASKSPQKIKSPSPVPVHTLASKSPSPSLETVNSPAGSPKLVELNASTIQASAVPVESILPPVSRHSPIRITPHESSFPVTGIIANKASTVLCKGFRSVEPPRRNSLQSRIDMFNPRVSIPGPYIPASKQNGDIRLPLQRKNSDSSIINMVIAPTINSKVEIQGAAALPDDKKEGNVETYLKMLQLLEKQDLITTAEKIDCPVCFLSVPSGEGVTLRDCLHAFCKECLVGAVQYAEESEVKCPFRDNDYSCNSTLQEREIKALVPSDVFENYLQRVIKLAERKMINTFHCKTNDCTGWCIFEDDVNVFKCPVCNQKNCITCAAIHEGTDCQQYQRELAIASETDENAKSSRLMLEKMIQRGEALDCPACHVVLLKKWGCDWVRCSYCKTEICWVTKGFRWGPGGKNDTTGGCKCGVNGVRCHPKCTYCH